MPRKHCGDAVRYLGGGGMFLSGLRPRLGATTGERVVRIATILVLLGGLWFRCYGYLWSPNALWLDEALWALMLIEGPLSDLILRPLGFLVITKALINAISASEAVLRFLPWCAAIGTLALVPLLARRLFNAPAARLLFVTVVALHPAAIDLAKEFKPYSISLFFHVATLWAVLEYVHARTAKRLAVLSVVLVPGVLFAQDIIFAYPSAVLITALAAYRARRVRHLLVLAGTAAATVALIGCLYVYAWSKIPRSDSNSWGKKYDVFYVADSHGKSYPEWLLRTYGASTTIPGLRREELGRERLSPPQRAAYISVDRAVWHALHLVGLFTIVRRRRVTQAAMLMLPLAIWVGFNSLGLWPLGPFRVNVFLVCYMAAIAAAALDRARLARAGTTALLPSLVLLVVPLLALEEVWHSKKLFFCHAASMPDVMEKLVSHYEPEPASAPRDVVFIDAFSAPMWRYYMDYHPQTREGLARRIRERFQLKYRVRYHDLPGRLREATARRGRSAWIVFSKEGSYEHARSSWLTNFRAKRDFVGEHELVQVRRRR